VHQKESVLVVRDKKGLQTWMIFVNCIINRYKSKSSVYIMDRVEQLKQIQAEALALFTKKNADYGDAFAKFGVIGVLMRIEDKIQRALSITKNGINLVDDETLRDTMIDLHNYSAMTMMLMDE
jgi:hypothetical protein